MTTHTSPISTVRKGVIQHWSRTLIPTSKEAPGDAETPSHKLLVRGGYIRRVAAGVYDYLPLAWRVLTKVADIVRDEMNNAGASELFMPVIVPHEFYTNTKRDEAYGPLLFTLEDRKGLTIHLGPTHEETITELAAGSVQSYKQLPLNLYQIQTKFRDEARPRAGLLRCREFIMKDAYSFHTQMEGTGGLNETYDAMYKAYVNTFTRCGLDFTVVEAESGPIGGSASHEFMVNCETGEDTILVCEQSGYAANVEKCEIGPRAHDLNAAPTGELAEVHTPNLPGIDEVGKFMKVKPDRMLKTIVFEHKDWATLWNELDRERDELRRTSGEAAVTYRDRHPKAFEMPRHRWVIVVVRGDHDVNEGKVKAAAGFDVELANPLTLPKHDFAVGYVSPRTINAERYEEAIMLIDPDAAQGGFWATGADKADHHVKHFNWRRDVGATLDDASRVRVADVRNAVAGDPSPRAPGSVLKARRGIEVGHIFKLGTKYSQAMGFNILMADQQRMPVIMGCYGIGVSRTMAACVEMSHDENGIIWPAPIAPYHVVITPLKVEHDSEAMRVARDLAKQLSERGFDVIIDDRDERPGVKFKDADLIGIPIRLTLGDKALAEGAVEFKLRKDTLGKGELVKLDAVVEKCVSAV